MRGLEAYFYADKSDIDLIFDEIVELGGFKYTWCYWDEVGGGGAKVRKYVSNWSNMVNFC